ncbi:MAG TPA: OsmC family protein [Gammaproteobacteria bacterium]|nr:OsmC family protein [Gammaproteobacteria bacterium]
METLPHRYNVAATGGPEGPVPVSADDLPTIETSTPVQFDGTGDRWSPEQLLIAAVADCFVLTFRSVARAARLDWRHLTAQVEGLLDRDDDRRMRFLEIQIQAEVIIPGESGRADAARCLDRAEKLCLITNSLTAQIQLHHQITVSAD